MNITKSELKQLIHETLSEAEFNPFKQNLAKSDATAAANAAAQAEFDRLDALKRKKPTTSAEKPVEYTIDYEKRMTNLIKRRDIFQKQIADIDVKLNKLGSQMKIMKSATDQLNLLNNQVKPLMDEKEKVLSDLKDVYDAMGESWGEVLKMYNAKFAALKNKK